MRVVGMTIHEEALVVHRELEARLRMHRAVRGVHGKVPGAGHIHARHRSLVVAVALGRELDLGCAHIHLLHRKRAIYLSVVDWLRMVVGDMQREGQWPDHPGMAGRTLQVHVPGTCFGGGRRRRSLRLGFRRGSFLATAQSEGQTYRENCAGQPMWTNGQTISPLPLQWEWPCSCAGLMGMTQPSATSQTANSNWMVVGWMWKRSPICSRIRHRMP